MKSDLTCPVEVVAVAVQNGVQDGHTEEVVCLIDFYNLSDKTIDSIQMNIICFDAEDTRLGGRLVRASAYGEGRMRFSGAFAPEHVENVARVEASVEKVWYQDGVIWRREERNVREYTPNALSAGRELDRLRAVAGPDAAGYAREDDTVWMCVCGRANRTSDGCCLRCQRERAYVLEHYSFAAIDSTLGRKERMLEQQTRDTLRRSSEQTVRQQTAEQKKRRKRVGRLRAVIALLVAAAALLALARWGVPLAVCRVAAYQFDKGLAADAKQLYEFVETYWPGEFSALSGAQTAERRIIDGLIAVGTDDALAQAAQRAQALGDDARVSRAVIARAKLAMDAGDGARAETLLAARPQDAAAQALLCEVIYADAAQAKEKLDYPTAIERFATLGDYQDAQAQREDSIYLYGRQLMRAGKYQAACDQFMQVTGTADAIALIRQCRYALAQELADAGDVERAAQLYESLGVYEEAETRARLCRYTAGMDALEAGDLARAAEQLKLAEEYEDAPARFADAAFTLGSAALEAGDNQAAIGWLEQLPRTDEVADALSRAVYAYAKDLERKGQKEAAAIEYASLGDYLDAQENASRLEYALALADKARAPEEALARFVGLGDYKDAREQALDCRFAIAQAALDAGDFAYALALFEQLGGARDAKEQAQRCRYALAGQEMAAKRYAEAAALYDACGAYLGAEDGALRARYLAADALFAAGEYEQAAAAFAALGSYEDAKMRVTASEDAWLGEAHKSALLDMELGDYESVIAALEPYWQADLPERYADMAGMYEQACLSRAQELTGTGRPLDALPVLERIPKNETAKKRMDAYVYRLIGRWKDTRGVEYVFRRDGSCVIAGEEGYFGGSGYEITVGSEPYPMDGGYTVVSMRNKTASLKNLDTGKTVRLNYLGEPEE